MSKYGKEDVYVTASDGRRILRERLSEYERTLRVLDNPDFLENRQKEDNMSNIEENTEVSKISDDSTVVNYIMLARIYDLLMLIADSLGKGEDALNLMNLHSQGQLMSPPPILQTTDEVTAE